MAFEQAKTKKLQFFGSKNHSFFHESFAEKSVLNSLACGLLGKDFFLLASSCNKQVMLVKNSAVPSVG